MFKKKDYIKVRGVGIINCRPELYLSDARTICVIAEQMPFITDETTGEKEFLPELVEYSFWVGLISVMTDYDMEQRDLWVDLHETDLSNKLSSYYCEYMDEIYSGVMDRINRVALSLQSVNETTMFNNVAKSLENVDVAEVLNLAQSISNMDEKEIVKAALETDAP